MSETPDTQPNLPRSGSVKKTAKFSILMYAILGFLVLIALGTMSGYFSGIAARQNAKADLENQQVEEQYTLGNQAVAEGNYELALTHYKYVIDHNPNYPGVQAAYTQLLLKMRVTPTPMFTDTPIFTPTPDLRGAQEIFDQVQSQITAGPKTIDDWTAIITSLDTLRKNYPEFQTAEVDGFYYTALRQRGIAQIFTQPCQNTNLEGGIYDLTLASNFGPLDKYADDLRTTARLYIIGSTYWELDWNQAAYFFGQVAYAAPNLMDSSCMTASRRWAYASIQLGNMYVTTPDYCAASTQYANASGVNIPEYATVAPTADYAYNQCNPAPPPPPPPPAETATPSSEAPTPTP